MCVFARARVCVDFEAVKSVILGDGNALHDKVSEANCGMSLTNCIGQDHS
jgi:hypothetical protein